MRVLVQRTRGATSIVSRDGEREISRDAFTGPGLVVLLGWMASDEGAELEAREEWLVSRTEGLRVFPDPAGKMNLDLAGYLRENKLTEGGILWVPQFTLAAKLESGFRPSYSSALRPDLARERFESLRHRLRARETLYRNTFGEFGADMELSFTNWGPVTIPLERA